MFELVAQFTVIGRPFELPARRLGEPLRAGSWLGRQPESLKACGAQPDDHRVVKPTAVAAALVVRVYEERPDIAGRGVPDRERDHGGQREREGDHPPAAAFAGRDRREDVVIVPNVALPSGLPVRARDVVARLGRIGNGPSSRRLRPQSVERGATPGAGGLVGLARPVAPQAEPFGHGASV